MEIIKEKSENGSEDVSRKVENVKISVNTERCDRIKNNKKKVMVRKM